MRLKTGSRCDEPVSGPCLRQQVARPGRIVLDLPAQLGDVDMEVVRFFAVGGAPDLPQDGGVRHQLAFVWGQHAEELELVRGQRNRTTADRDRALVEIDDQLADLEHWPTRGT